MSSRKITNSNSGYEERCATMDEKKRRRMISNRESARRSRMKKEHYVKDLNEQIMCFKARRDEIIRKINEVARGYATVELENRILRTRREELRKRLESAEVVSGYVHGTGGYSMDNDGPQEPWLPSFHPLSIMTSDGLFQF